MRSPRGSWNVDEHGSEGYTEISVGRAELGVFHLTGPEIGTGDTLDVRFHSGLPYAATVRLLGDGPSQLAVSRLDRGCVVAIVPAGSSQSPIARRVADKAQTMRCITPPTR